MATAIMKQKEVPEMDDVAEIISKISEDSPYKRRPTQPEAQYIQFLIIQSIVIFLNSL